MYLDNSVQSYTSLGEDALDVLTALCGLVRNAALDQVALGIGRDLTRHEDLRSGDDGLGLCCVSASLRGLSNGAGSSGQAIR